MNTPTIAVVLDIGTTKIAVLVGQLDSYRKLEILGYGTAPSLGVQRGVVVNITQTIESIKQAIEAAKLDCGFDITGVVVGIAGQHIRSLQHSDYITRVDSEEVIDELDLERLTENVHKLAMMPGEEIIHVIPQEYKVDGQGDIKEPCGMYGARLEATFHIVVGQVTSIRNIARCVKSSDLELKALNLEPLASAKAVLSQEEKEAGVVLVDIGGGTTDIAIFKDGIIRHTAVIPYGGNIITNDIKEGCSIIEKQAEQLKVKFGSAWPGENKENEIVSIPGLRGRDPKEISLKTLSRIIHARTTEIINAVFTEVKNYGYDQPSRKLIAGVVITGGGSQLKHVKQLVEYLTGMDTRIGYPNEHLAALPLDHALNSPMYATAVGLLMKGLEGRDLDVYVRESDPALTQSPELESTHWDLSPAPADAIEPADEVLVEHLGELETAPAAGGSGAEQPQKTKAKGDFFKRWADGFLKLIDDNDLN